VSLLRIEILELFEFLVFKEELKIEGSNSDSEESKSMHLNFSTEFFLNSFLDDIDWYVEF